MSTLTIICMLAGLLGSDPAAETKSIQKIFAERQEAWARRDVAALVSDFADDADTIESSGTVTRGRAAISERYTALAKSPLYADAKFEQEVVQVRLHGTTVAVVDGTWKVMNLKDDAGKLLPDRNGHSTAVLVHNGKKWQIVALRSHVRSK